MARVYKASTQAAPQLRRLVGLAVTLGVVALATAISWFALGEGELADIVMLYLLGTVLVSMRYEYALSIGSAVASVLAFNFFFIPPRFTFAVADFRHVVTLAVFLIVALVTSGLTQRLRAQAELRIQIEREQLRNALLSSVSHDLRTPLAVVTGAASSLLEDELEPSVRRELTQTILEEADRLNRLVQNLLDMTRLESGALAMKKQWQSLEEVIGTALERAEPILAGRAITTDVPSSLSLVPFDSILIEQVLQNLLENAAKYTPKGSPIHVAAGIAGGAAIVEVSDRGPGIARADAERVFDKFHRGSRDRLGAGLGLTICRGIVHAHGGRISCEPREGGGATFRFTLPIEGEAPTVARELRAEAT